jgi:hypothetical protein
MNDSYRSLRRHPLALAFGFGCLLTGGTAAADSDLLTAYSGLNCDPSLADFVHYKRPSGFEAIDDARILCPIDRDATAAGRDGVPEVTVEGYNHRVDPADSEFHCSVFWLEEDGDGVIRGFSSTLTASRAGYFQLVFDDPDYASGVTLSSGGEGTMSLMCEKLHGIDQLTQYKVLENKH